MRLIFKDFPLPSHRLARTAHEAARCAGAVGAYWRYHDRLFQQQPRFEREDLVAYAVDLGLERARFEQCLNDRLYASVIDEDILQGRALGVTGTPTFLINGRPLVGAVPVEAFREAIDEALKSR